MPTGRQRRIAIKHADIVQSKKASFEHVPAIGIFSVDPPCKVEQQLVEDALEKYPIARTATLLLDLIDAPSRPSIHRRVHIAECPLVGWQLTVGMHVPFANHQCQLSFGEF